MSANVATREWGPADVGTLCGIAALTVVFGGGLGFFWANVTVDPAALKHSLVAISVILAIAADVAFMAHQVRGLLALRRRP
jgi:hypothetical protein